jgi:uncharacterized membrane protein HdeD (DUF308 family)
MSFVAILFYFLFPDPELAVPGALIIQTIAFITIGGQSLVDALLLVGISLILIGYLPSDHTLISGSTQFEQVRWPLLLSGAVLAVTMLVIIIYRIRKNINLTNKVFHPRPK